MDSSTKQLMAKTEVITTELQNGETVLLDMESRKYFSLNETGTELWKMLTGGCTLIDMNAALASRYAVDDATLEASVRDIVRDLESANLIREV